MSIMPSFSIATTSKRTANNEAYSEELLTQLRVIEVSVVRSADCIDREK